jgi:sugar lactone lactonase YvrE
MQATSVNFCDANESLSALALDDEGNLYVAACWLQRIAPNGVLSIVAGNGNYSFGGDGAPATAAQLFGPTGLALDRSGNLYIADMGNNRIRKVRTDGKIETIAGSDTYGYAGDGGPATAAQTSAPFSVAVDREGNIFFTDSGNH